MKGFCLTLSETFHTDSICLIKCVFDRLNKKKEATEAMLEHHLSHRTH